MSLSRCRTPIGSMCWSTGGSSGKASRAASPPRQARRIYSAQRRSALRRIAPVDRDRGSGDEVRGLAREEHGDTGKVVRPAPTAGGRPRDDFVVEVRHILSCTYGEICIDPAREYDIDLNIVLGPGAGEGLGELYDTAFGGAVWRREIGAEERGHRADIDDLAAGRL